MTGKIEQTMVDHPNVYGYQLTLGDRQAIVARTDSCCGHWTVFHYQNKRQWCIGFSKPDTDRTTAMREARNYLRTGVLPQNGTGKTPKPFRVENPDNLLN